MREIKHTRRNFIKTGVVATAGITFILWDKMIGKHQNIVNRKTISVPFNPNREISFFEEFIIVHANSEIKVFSSRCTHLGCKINSQLNNQLLCPCHGSAFNLSGEVLKGPAIRSLPMLEFELSNDGNTITVKT